MEMNDLKFNTINKVVAKDLLTKSNLPESDFVINPYVGCLHACRYCYACFMKRYTGHDHDQWGNFIDVKVCEKPIDLKKLEGKKLFMSSVTDCYNPLEEKCQATRRVLEQLKTCNVNLQITTKSKLILRDLDLLKQFKNLTVAFSINTLDEDFRADMDKASSIQERLEALKILHENGIKTVLFMSPIFPEITYFRAIIMKTKAFVDEFWFEDLNLRGEYKFSILKYIKAKHPKLASLYYQIYVKGDRSYWTAYAKEIEAFCQLEAVKFKIYFHHQDIRKNKIRK